MYLNLNISAVVKEILCWIKLRRRTCTNEEFIVRKFNNYAITGKVLN
jgi:hypothetical protein